MKSVVVRNSVLYLCACVVLALLLISTIFQLQNWVDMVAAVPRLRSPSASTMNGRLTELDTARRITS